MSRITIDDPVIGFPGAEQTPFGLGPASGSFETFTPSTNLTIDDPVADVSLTPGQQPLSAITIDDPFVGENGQVIREPEPANRRTKELLQSLDYYRSDPEGKKQVEFENRRAYATTRIPILNLGVAAEGYEVYQAAKRLEANQYDESYESQFQFNDDTARIARFFVRQESLAEGQKDKTWGAKFLTYCL